MGDAREESRQDHVRQLAAIRKEQVNRAFAYMAKLQHWAATMDRQPSKAIVVAALISLTGIGILSYLYAAALPYRIDDFVHFRWLYERSLADVWTNAAGLAYYRPLPFTLWKLIYWLFGAYPPVLLHLINVGLHAANGALVLLLIWLHRGRSLQALIQAGFAAVLFVLFPFSYQAVPWVGALSHPMVTAFVLSSIVLAVWAQMRHSSRLSAMALVLAFVAPFAHETGVLIAPLLTLFIYTSHLRPSLRHAFFQTRLFWVCTVVVVLVLVFLRINAGLATAVPDLESRLQNGVYFLQGLLYPVAPLATHLMQVVPSLNDLGAVAIVCLPALALLCVIYWRTGLGRQALFAIGWFVIAILPAWSLLPFAYVVDGPRLMYASSVGAAAFWALPIAALIVHARQSWTKVQTAVVTAFAGVIVAAALGVSNVFLRERADMYEQTRRAAQGLIESVPSWREGDRSLAVNFPGWIAPKRQTFALGHEGVSFIPDYSSIMDLVWTMTGRERFSGSFVVRELQAHWRHNFRNYGPAISLTELQPQLRGVERVLFTSNRRDNLVTYDAGSLEAVNQFPPLEYVSSFNDEIVLIGGDWKQVNDTLEVTLHWYCQNPPEQEVRTYVHLQALNNELMAQEDGSPLMGLSSPIWWKAGDQWRDLRVIVLPADLKPGSYVLRVGVYPVTGEARLPALNSAGVRYENDSATLGEFILP